MPSTLEDLFDTVRSGVRRSADIYIDLCSLLERVVKRKEGLATEYFRFSTTLKSLTEVTEGTYKIDPNDVPMLNEGINSTAKHMLMNQSILEDEGRSWDVGVLEDFKRERDGLVSMRDMFDRRDRLAKDNIPQLERRIQGNEIKLAGNRAKSDSQRKPGEVEKVEDAIMKVYLTSTVLRRSNVSKMMRCRTNNRLSTCTQGVCSSKSASAMKFKSFKARNIVFRGCTMTGVRSG